MVARMPRVNVNPEDLTPYEVAREGWITDGRGHSALRTPAAEGEKPNTVDLVPMQAEYLINSGHIKPIPGETKGYPADAVTGEAIELSHEDRSRIESLPPLDPDGDNTAVEDQGRASEEQAAEVATTEEANDPEPIEETKSSADDPGLETTPVTLGNTSGDEAAQQDSAQDALAPESTATPVSSRPSRRGR